MSLILSLFPGIGLLDHAFEAEGFCVVRGPDRLWGGDIREFHPPPGRFDGVIGGPPCQCFSSLARLVEANGYKPKFGNLIPEFERCVEAAKPEWFLMENVPKAPEPSIDGYGVKSFLIDNSRLLGEGVFGLEQRRIRRFTFGIRGRQQVPSLMRWVDLAVFLLPDATAMLTRHETLTGGNDRPPSARRRIGTVTSGHMNPEALTRRHRVPALTGDLRAVPVAVGGSGKLKRAKAVSGSNGGNGSQRNTPGAGNGGKGRYRLPDACRLQGLPEDFLADSPFTSDGKLKAIANGVPIPMGRAMARAVKEALIFGGH